jgi:hypothetical protein
MSETTKALDVTREPLVDVFEEAVIHLQLAIRHGLPEAECDKWRNEVNRARFALYSRIREMGVDALRKAFVEGFRWGNNSEDMGDMGMDASEKAARMYPRAALAPSQPEAANG